MIGFPQWVAFLAQSRLRSSTFVMLATLPAVEPAGAQKPPVEEELPEGSAIIEKYIEAIGGRAAREKFSNRVMKGTFEQVGSPARGPVTIYEGRPNKHYMLLEIPGRKVEAGTDGQTVWERQEHAGARVLTGEERAEALRDSIYDYESRWREIFEEAKCVGTESRNERTYYEIILTPPEGDPATWYIDAESSLLVRTEQMTTSPKGKVRVTAMMGDYREVDGILLPHRVQVSTPMGVQRLTFETIEHNVKLPENFFDPPEDVKALLESAPKEPGAPPSE